jgi:hypothetical protein
MHKHLLLAAAAAAALASMASAQIGRETLVIDLETPTGGNNGHLGCAYDLINGRIYTTSRGNGTATVGPHTINVWDTSGALLTSLGQTPASDATTWGYRDGASSIVGQVFFGWDGGIDVYDVDPTTGNLLPAASLIAAGGVTALTQPSPTDPGLITSAAVGGTHRALAFNFYGNGGLGSFFTGNFGGDIFEIDAAGNVLNQFPNTSAITWSSYGFALDDKGDADETNDTLWINAAPNASRIVEYSIDRINLALTPTGLSFDRNQPGTAQGGLALVPGGLDGRNCGYDLIGVDQGTPDTLAGYRVIQWEGSDPANEPQLLTGVDGGTLSADASIANIVTTTLEVDVQSAGTAGLPYVLYADVEPFTARAPGPLPFVGASIWEFAFPNLTGVSAGTFVGGTPAVFPNFLTTVPAGTSVTWQAFCIDVSAPVAACGQNLTFLGLPWATSTMASHTRGVDPQDIATIRATGANSFNNDTTSGFFSITADANSAADPIVSVTFDWATSSNPAQGTMVFDTDQTGMANTFGEGNGGGCGGTYRNGSDVTVGLDYTNAANNLLDTTTCPTSVAHCEATNATTAPSYQTLKWYFTPGTWVPGAVFEFDIDTDGGAGITGDAMAGMVVTVETLSGAIYTGELQVDLATPQSSFVKL